MRENESLERTTLPNDETKVGQDHINARLS
jgi:hypothetical protein